MAAGGGRARAGAAVAATGASEDGKKPLHEVRRGGVEGRTAAAWSQTAPPPVTAATLQPLTADTRRGDFRRPPYVARDADSKRQPQSPPVCATRRFRWSAERLTRADDGRPVWRSSPTAKAPWRVNGVAAGPLAPPPHAAVLPTGSPTQLAASAARPANTMAKRGGEGRGRDGGGHWGKSGRGAVRSSSSSSGSRSSSHHQ